MAAIKKKKKKKSNFKLSAPLSVVLKSMEFDSETDSLCILQWPTVFGLRYGGKRTNPKV